MPPAWRAAVALMRAAPEDVRMLTRCCEILHETPVSELADGADAVVAVVAALRFLVARGSRSLHHALFALGTLVAASAVNRQAAASAGALDAALATMRAAIDDAEIQFLGCTALAHLAVAGVMRADGAAEAAFGAIVAAHRAHPESDDVLSETQGAIRSIILEDPRPLPATANTCEMLKPAAVKAAIKAGAIEMLLAQIRTHTRNEDDDMLHRCFFVLAHLYYERDSCDRKLMLAVECIQLIVPVMVTRSGVVRMQAQSCFALSNVARHAPDHEMIRTGGLSAAVKALLQYESEWNVQQNACGVLEAACETASSDTAVFAVSLGAFTGVVAALRAHPNHEEVQRAACGALCWLAVRHKKQQRHAAGMAAAIEPLVAALRTFPANPFLQRFGCLALSRVISERIAPIQRAVEAGAIEAILAGMDAISDAASSAVNVHSPSTYQSGCEALIMLVMLSPATEERAVCAVAAIEDVVVATRGLQSDYPSDVEVCEAVLKRLRAAVLRHDRGRCGNAACKRCAAARERGAMCALPSCSARARPDGKKLKRCGRCLVAAYCGEAHQREHWPTHRPLCRAAADADASAGADHDDASAAMERLSI